MSAKKKPDTTELLALVCKALSERYRTDPSKPGVQVAHIPEAGKWYLAVHRYQGSFGSSRFIAHKLTHEDLDQGLILLAKLVSPPPDSAQRELAAAVKGLG